MRTAGLVLDFYDDPDKSTLREAFPSYEEVPEIVKTAHYLEPEERAALRDEAYALILQNEGRTLRKFACVDEGNTLLSALYLEAHAAKLPEEAIKVAAANLLNACEQFGLEPTEFIKNVSESAYLEKEAGLPKALRSGKAPRVPNGDNRMAILHRVDANTRGQHLGKHLVDPKNVTPTPAGTSGISPEMAKKFGKDSRLLSRQGVSGEARAFGKSERPSSGLTEAEKVRAKQKLEARKAERARAAAPKEIKALPPGKGPSTGLAVSRPPAPTRPALPGGSPRAAAPAAAGKVPPAAAGSAGSKLRQFAARHGGKAALGLGAVGAGALAYRHLKKKDQGQQKTASKKNIKRERDPMMEQYVGDEADWAQRTNLNSISGSQPSGRVQESAAVMKTAFARTVDVTGLDPVGVEKVASVEHLALDTYPLDAYGDVVEAVSFFEENWTSLDPAERHEYAVKTASRADELGIPTTDLLDRYGATDYAPDADAHLASRMAIVQEPGLLEIYGDLREKRASIEPEVFAELLGEVDELAGLNWSYGGEVADPYFAVFGGRGKEKAAGWLYNDGMGLVVNENQLKYLAEYGRVMMLQNFSEDIVNAFQKNPVQIFDSLPADTKKIIGRMAASSSEKTAAFIGPAADLAGLGILAVPGIKTLRDKGSTAKEKNHAKWETAGLGTLAAGVAVNDRHELAEGAKNFMKSKGFGNKLRSAGNLLKGGIGKIHR